MGLTTADYLSLLQALLPPGSAWPHEPAATLTKTLTGLSEELARLDGRGADLVQEMDPRTTLELLADWERVGDLSAGDLPTGERRTAVAMMLTAVGGSSLAYFQGLATVNGYDVTITEGPEPHVWRVTFNNMNITYFTAGDSSAGDLLSDWPVNASIQGLFEHIKPAHTRLVIAYA